MSASLSLALCLLSPALSGAGLQLAISVDSAAEVVVCDGTADDSNSTTGVLDFDRSVGVLAVNGRLRESVDTGTKRIIVSANPDDLSARPARFRNTSAVSHTVRIRLLSAGFLAAELNKLAVRCDGCASDTVPASNSVIVTGQTLLGYLDPSDPGSNSISVSVPNISQPTGTVCFTPSEKESASARFTTSGLQGQWDFTLGPNDQIEFTSSIEISAQQVRPSGRLVQVMSERKKVPTLGALPFESVTIFDGGAGDLTGVDGQIVFNTEVGEGFVVSGTLRESLVRGAAKSLVLVNGASFQNVSSVDRVFQFEATSSFFEPECFGSQSVRHQFDASDAMAGSVGITDQSLTGTTPIAVSRSVPNVTMPGSFGPFTASVAGLASGSAVGLRWTFTSEPADQIVITAFNTTASVTAAACGPALTDFGRWVALGSLVAFGLIMILRRSHPVG